MILCTVCWVVCDNKMGKCGIVNTDVRMHNFCMTSFVTYSAGLGEICESLLKDDSLTPEDFCYKQDVSLYTCTSQQAAYYNDCLQSSKTVDNDKFKTPLTSKNKDSNISETPCLFSQDESVTHTPTPSKWFGLFRGNVHVNGIMFTFVCVGRHYWPI